MMEIIVIALGGNALLDPSSNQSFSRQNKNINRITKDIANLCKRRSVNVVITHGNGSQVGDELIRNEHSKKFIHKLPFYAINAETQALIGTTIETSLRNSLNRAKVKRDVCTILTHVLVDRKDPAFKNPVKQIGPFYNSHELGEELRLDRFPYVKIGSEYRRVVASPMPKRILELGSIKKHSEKEITIACGGGGIPTAIVGNELIGVDAVIDKDLTTQLLANSIGAKTMLMLTNTDFLYGKDGKPIRIARAGKLKSGLKSFEDGTIRPKVEACIRFIENGGKEAYIGNIFELGQILEGRSGTKII